MTYTILSVKYSNPDHTAVIISTQEFGDILCSFDNEPDLWIKAISGKIDDYQEILPQEQI